MLTYSNNRIPNNEKEVTETFNNINKSLKYYMETEARHKTYIYFSIYVKLKTK